MKSGPLLGLGAALALSAPVQALQLDYTLKATAAGEFNGGRDVGLLGRPDDQQGYLDVTPWVHAQFSPAWSAFLRVRAFVPTGSVLVQSNDNNNVGTQSSAFIGLKEAWVDYRGLTSYPGESLRVGRQRTREPDAQWWDEDLDSARFIFDTTLLQAEAAVAHQFDTYRSDGAPVPLLQRNRTYVFGSVSTEWRPDQLIGVRVVHAEDSGRPPQNGEVVDQNRKLTDGSPTWINVFADNHAYDYLDTTALNYWASASLLAGPARRALIDPTRTVVGHEKHTVIAGAGEAGLRYRLSTSFPLQVGASYVYSSGGTGSDRTSEYEQTGVQSNYSRFTGTRSLINRFNDAYRAELGNLEVITGFASIVAGPYDASVIYNRFIKAHGSGPVISDGLAVNPVNNSSALGDGYDVVLTRYFGQRYQRNKLAPGENTETSIRIRGAVFNPGAAYGPTAELEYRATLEFTLWY